MCWRMPDLELGGGVREVNLSPPRETPALSETTGEVDSDATSVFTSSCLSASTQPLSTLCCDCAWSLSSRKLHLSPTSVSSSSSGIPVSRESVVSVVRFFRESVREEAEDMELMLSGRFLREMTSLPGECSAELVGYIIDTGRSEGEP